jgi:heme exporter protein C
LVLITGPIWAKPIWGTWWTWDARLTSTLILWLIFAAYLMLRSVSPGVQGARYAAVLAIVGAADVPIINRAVYWWRTIHPAVLNTREGGTGLADPRMQLTLLVSFIGFFLLFLWLARLRTESLRLNDSVEELRQQALTAWRT